MYIAPDSGKPLWHSLLAQVKDGTIPMARLDDAVTRILRVKMRLGLFEAGKPSSRLLSGKYDELGRSEEHTSELQSLMRISYAVFCLKKNKTQNMTSIDKTLLKSLTTKSCNC